MTPSKQSAEERVEHTPRKIAKKVVDDFFSVHPRYRTGERLEDLIAAELAEREALVSALRGLVIVSEGYVELCKVNNIEPSGAMAVIKAARAALQAAGPDASVSPKEKAIR